MTHEPVKLMKALQIYLFCTIALYFLGPIKWQTVDTVLTFSVVLFYQLFLALGYQYGKPKKISRRKSAIFSIDWFIRHYVLISSIHLILSTIRMIRIARLYGYSGIGGLMNAAFSSRRSIYFAQQLETSGSNMFGGSLFSLLHALFGPLTVTIIPTTISIFRNIKGVKRGFAIANIVIFILGNIISGTNEGYIHIVLYILVGLLMRPVNNKRFVKTKKEQRRKKLIIVFGALLVVVFFNIVMSDRNGSYYQFSQLRPNTIDESNWLIKLMPGFKVLLIWLTGYICQGYYGMSLSLGSHWTPMFGTGFSSYLRGNIEKILGENLAEKTLMYQTAQYGWQYGVNWHTAYTWFACDVWWLGVPFIMFFVGYWLQRSYREAYNTHDPISIGMFSLLMMMVVFLPANNKVFALSDTFFAFFFYLAFQVLSKKEILENEF